jgi:hypothetical protein
MVPGFICFPMTFGIEALARTVRLIRQCVDERPHSEEK